MDSRVLLEVRDLHTQIVTRRGVVKAVNGVSLTLHEGEVLGLVGESGSGKTMTALSILRVLPYAGRTTSGQVFYRGRDLLKMRISDLRRIRGKEISMVMQNASSALDPVMRIGAQVVEAITAHDTSSRRDAERQAVQTLGDMGLPDPERMMRQYPYQLSGGMAQRVVLAMAVALRPSVLIADEPTSGLDVTLQAEILSRLQQLQQESRTAVLLITHDIGVVSVMAQRVAVIYAGSIVEEGEVRHVLDYPLHPYTWSLLRAVPRIDNSDQRLEPIKGMPPDLTSLPDQCPFLPRCPKAVTVCRLDSRPSLDRVDMDGHRAACYNPVRHDQRLA
ncbi:MAG: ABC transporter ATP-binding protein [Chloroflexi bacterium]|nr:ABC transporter ATP-binding protein [Chloroflexota bacterium]